MNPIGSMITKQAQEVNMVEVSDIIGWGVTICMAFLIYLMFQRHQIRIARYPIVRGLEEEIATLFRSKAARTEVSTPGGCKWEPLEYRAVLDNEPPWTFEPDASASLVAGWQPPKYELIDGQRHWFIRAKSISGSSSRQVLSSQALQETLLWFRKVNRAHNDGIIKSKELPDLWHFILPIGFAGRAAYLAKYFQGAEDVQAIVRVINATLRACLKKGLRRPLHYFATYVTEMDREVLITNKNSQRLHQEVAKAGK